MGAPTQPERYQRAWGRWFSGATLVAALGLAYPLQLVAPLLRTSALWGWLVSFVLCATGGYMAFWALRQQTKTFMLVVFGGLTARLLLAGAALILAVLVFDLNPAAFAAGLLGSYSVYQTIEIVMIQRQQTAACASQDDSSQ